MTFPSGMATIGGECQQTSATKKERSLKRAASLSGMGLFTGQKATIQLLPAKSGHGIIFQRSDLPSKPLIPAKLECVQGTTRCTMLGHQGATVQTVEHLLSALKGFGIDNLLIDISGPEVPIFDGSSAAFVQAIEESGIEDQESTRPVYKLKEPLFWTQGDIHLVALPSDELRVSYTLHYPHSTFLRAQYYTTLVTEEKYKKEIASCRTFCLYEEIAPLIEKGLVKGGGLENAVIIKEEKVINPDGLRFVDEMARHKVLDLLGDLSLMQLSFIAHIIAVRSGHTSNVSFARDLLNFFTQTDVNKRENS